MYTLYILRCRDKSLYTGITNDLEKRLLKHNSGQGAKYVRSRLPFTLVYTTELQSKSEALKLEIEIKSWHRTKKLQLIAGWKGNLV